jgi:hypothetical protein
MTVLGPRDGAVISFSRSPLLASPLDSSGIGETLALRAASRHPQPSAATSK